MWSLPKWGHRLPSLKGHLVDPLTPSDGLALDLWHGEWGWRSFLEKIVSMGCGLQWEGGMTEKSDWAEYVLEGNAWNTKDTKSEKSETPSEKSIIWWKRTYNTTDIKWGGHMTEQQRFSLRVDAQWPGTGRKPLGGRYKNPGVKWWGSTLEW